MAHLGNYLVGDSVAILLATIDLNGAPVKPDATPTYHIIKTSDGGYAELTSRPAGVLVDRSAAGVFQGLFSARHRIGGGFAGQGGGYVVVKKWVISGNTYHACDTFTVDNALNDDDSTVANGQVIGAEWTPRNGGVAIHFDAEAGNTYLGLNPH